MPRPTWRPRRRPACTRSGWRPDRSAPQTCGRKGLRSSWTPCASSRPGTPPSAPHRANVSRVLEQVSVTRYVTPLREGGSLPALVEADNLGTYVLKFRGAGQGPLALVAEVIAGELARALGLRTPELALADLDPRIAASEPDEEIQDLLRASAGLNLAVDFLPGSAGFDPLGWTVDEDFASELLWFDALTQNVDRTWRNPNLLVWHGSTWLIDHGAALYFHHDWSRADPAKPYDARNHVLRERAKRIEQAHEKLAPLITAATLERVIADVPSDWFGLRGGDAYVDQLVKRAPL